MPFGLVSRSVRVLFLTIPAGCFYSCLKAKEEKLRDLVRPSALENGWGCECWVLGLWVGPIAARTQTHSVLFPSPQSFPRAACAAPRWTSLPKSSSRSATPEKPCYHFHVYLSQTSSCLNFYLFIQVESYYPDHLGSASISRTIIYHEHLLVALTVSLQHRFRGYLVLACTSLPD